MAALLPSNIEDCLPSQDFGTRSCEMAKALGMPWSLSIG